MKWDVVFQADDGLLDVETVEADDEIHAVDVSGASPGDVIEVERVE